MGHTGTGPHGSSNDNGEIFTPYPVTQDENNRVIAETLRLQEKIAILEAKIEHLQARLRQYEPDPEMCEHGVVEGDWCEPCNAEYKRAAATDGDIEIL